MKINQLFRDKVPEELVQRVLGCFGIRSMEDIGSFCKEDLVTQETLSKIKEHIESLKPYYLPCKARIYLQPVNEQDCITILRQVVRLYNKTVESSQRYVNHKKVTFYSLKDEGDYRHNINLKLTQELVRVDFA